MKEKSEKVKETSKKLLENAVQTLAAMKQHSEKIQDEADLMRTYYLSDGMAKVFFLVSEPFHLLNSSLLVTHVGFEP